MQLLTKGSQTTDMTLRRNALGQLGFHVNFEGIVAEVEPYGYAWQAGLRQGSRLVEICKVAVASLSHEQMIDLLRTSVTVKVVIIPPHDDSTPRRLDRVANEPGVRSGSPLNCERASTGAALKSTTCRWWITRTTRRECPMS